MTSVSNLDWETSLRSRQWKLYWTVPVASLGRWRKWRLSWGTQSASTPTVQPFKSLEHVKTKWWPPQIQWWNDKKRGSVPVALSTYNIIWFLSLLYTPTYAVRNDQQAYRLRSQIAHLKNTHYAMNQEVLEMGDIKIDLNPSDAKNKVHSWDHHHVSVVRPFRFEYLFFISRSYLSCPDS